jgi:hypothetical protein
MKLENKESDFGVYGTSKDANSRIIEENTNYLT